MFNRVNLVNKIRKKNQKAIAIKGKVCYNYQDKPSNYHHFISTFTNPKKIKKISKNLLTNRRRWCIIPYVAAHSAVIRGSGGTGRRARLRGVWFTPYGFKSRFPHQNTSRFFNRLVFFIFSLNFANAIKKIWHFERIMQK